MNENTKAVEEKESSTANDLTTNLSTLGIAALYYASKKGWYVFPLAPKSKVPFPNSKGQHDSSCDLAVIREWWTRWPDANIGLDLEKSKLVALDVDHKVNGVVSPKLAAEKLKAAETKFGRLPETVTQITGSACWHLIFKAPPVRMRGEIEGITVRGANYIAVAPSIHPDTGREYAWEKGCGFDEIDPADLPGAWASAIAKAAVTGDVTIPEEESEPDWLRKIPQEKRVELMRAKLAKEAPEIKGVSPQSLLFTIATSCARGFAIRDPKAVIEALREYNSRCVPPYDDERLVEKVVNAYEKSDRAWGSADELGAYSLLRPASDTERVYEDFNTGKDGLPFNSQRNVNVALDRLEVRFTFDELANQKIMRRHDGAEVVVQDKHVNALRFEIDRTHKFMPPKEYFYDLVNDKAHMNSFHPIVDYLDKLPDWDGVPRIETWLIAVGAPDTAYVRAVSRLPLIAAVRRIRSPGAKFDEMLVIEGKTGIDKSSVLASLVPDKKWFTDTLHLSDDEKHMLEQTMGKWIVEAAELKGLSKADRGALKSYLSRSVDSARLSYDRENTYRPRGFIIIGTTNEDANYLNDPTGNRRYWPVKITKTFNVVKLRAERDQMWAEASFIERSNPADIRMDQSLWADAAVEQESRRAIDPYEEELERELGGREGKIRVSDVKKLVGFSDKQPTQAENNRIGDAMRFLGWTKTAGPTSFCTPGNDRAKDERAFVKGRTDHVINVEIGHVKG